MTNDVGFQLWYEYLNKLFPDKNQIHLLFQLHNKITYTLGNLVSNLLNHELCENPVVWEDSFYKPNNKEPVGLILTVGMKNKTFPKASFFSWEQD